MQTTTFCGRVRDVGNGAFWTAVLSVSGLLCVARPLIAQVPQDLQASVEKMQDALFRGDYDNARRGLAEASEALRIIQKRPDNVENEKDIEGLAEVFLKGLQVELALSADGELQGRKSLREAKQALSNKFKNLPGLFSLCDAYLDLLEGELESWPPGHGVYANQAAIKARNTKALASLARARRTLDKLLVNNANPPFVNALNVVAMSEFQPSHLMVRVALGEAELRRAGFDTAANPPFPGALLPGAQAAVGLIDKARFELNKNGMVQELFLPQMAAGAWPLCHRNLADWEKEKRQQFVLAQDQLLAWQSEWRCVLSDFIRMNLLQAEVEAIKQVCGAAQPGDLAVFSPQAAETTYLATLWFLRDHYGPTHPLFAEAELSLARWYVLLSTPAQRPDNLKPVERCRSLSYAWDAVFMIRRIEIHAKEQDNKLMRDRVKAARLVKLKDELQRLEARALENILSWDELVRADVNMQNLRAGQRDALEARIEEVEDLLEKPE